MKNLRYTLEDLKKAFKKLKECVAMEPESYDLVVDATILRFEFTYELSLKIMKTYLKHKKNIDIHNSIKIIEEAFKAGLISQEYMWFNMIQDRKITSFTYDEDNVIDLFNDIAYRYVALFNDFIENMEGKVEGS